jgi:YbbR domain-containing protein
LKKETAQRHTLKITAFFFAISLWYYVLNSEAVEVDKKLPLNFILPKGMLITSVVQAEVSIKLKGSKAFIKNIFLNKEKITIDLTAYYKPDAQPENKSFKVKIYPSDINVPFGVSILEIAPKELLIELDHKVIKEVTVKLQQIGTLPIKRRIKEMKIIPDKLMLSGPMELLRDTTTIETVPINLALLNKDEGTLPLKLGEIDSRLKIEEGTAVKLKYKTQEILSKDN